MGDILSVMLFAGGLALVGGALLWRGLRGRRVGDHPYCRRCGFNLFGSASDIKVCPECGADLTIPRATLVGVLQRRWGLATVGAILLLPSLSVLAIVGVGTLQDVNWNQYKPVWYLAREADSIDPARHNIAMNELLKRLNAGKLSASDTSNLIDQALKVQAQTSKPWPGTWGDFVEVAHRRKLISDPQWKTYASQALAGSVTLRMRERYRPGDPALYRLNDGGARVGRIGGSLLRLDQISGFVVDGKELMTGPEPWIGGTNLSPNGRGWSGSSLGERGIFSALSPGTHSGFLRLHVKVTDDMNALRLPDALNHPPANPTAQSLDHWNEVIQAAQMNRFQNVPALVDTELKLPVTFEIIPPDQSPLKRIDDEKLRADVESSLSLDRITVQFSRMEIPLNCDRPPVDLSYAVLLRDGKKEWPIGKVAYAKGQSSGPIRFQPDFRLAKAIDQPLSNEVDLILRPDPEAAVGDPSIYTYWGGEVVIKSVQVDDPDRHFREQRKQMEAMVRSVQEMKAPPPATAATRDGHALLQNLSIDTKGGVYVKVQSVRSDAVVLSTRQILAFPGVPFVDCTTEPDGTSTRICGIIQKGSDAKHFKLKLDFAQASEDAVARSFQANSYAEPAEITVGSTVQLGSTGDIARTVTLTLPE